MPAGPDVDVAAPAADALVPLVDAPPVGRRPLQAEPVVAAGSADSPTGPTAVEHPVARVAVDVSLTHLDRPFDYAVTPAQDQQAVPGARVRVRFAGQLRDGFVLERADSTEHVGPLAPLHKVISAEPALSAEIAGLVRAVADHYAGCFADVVRLAVPPRHAATEKAAAPPAAELPAWAGVDGPWSAYDAGPALLSALREGRSPRAAWTVVPAAHPQGDWAVGLALAAHATALSGRGAVLVVPDTRDLSLLEAACRQVLGPDRFAVLTAEAGPVARYRAFLAASRGAVKVVIGNRAAVYAPVRDLGLVAVHDDGDDLLAEPRAPYPHAREVAAIRAARAGAAVVYSGHTRSAEVQLWVDRGWLRPVVAERTLLRHTAPGVRISNDTDRALARDPAARAARLPHEAFELLRGALPQGPVLVQVPRSGYLVALVCQECREPAPCQACDGPVAAGSGQLRCGWCGRGQVEWECRICGSRRVRAPVVGAERTAEELGKAFPQTPVRRSSAGHILTEVPGGPAIVVATPGAEPRAAGGYAAALLLDTAQLLLRPDLRAAEEALRRWLNVVALVRPGYDGGSVLAIGDSGSRALQALVRLDPAGFAQRELTDRADAGFPPQVRFITVEGSPQTLEEVIDLVELPTGAHLLGPVDVAVPPSPAGTGSAGRSSEAEEGRGGGAGARTRGTAGTGSAAGSSRADGDRSRPSGPGGQDGAGGSGSAAAGSTSDDPGGGPRQRLILRSRPHPGRAESAALVRAVRDVLGVRSARKSEGALRVRVDPTAIG